MAQPKPLPVRQLPFRSPIEQRSSDHRTATEVEDQSEIARRAHFRMIFDIMPVLANSEESDSRQMWASAGEESCVARSSGGDEALLG